MKQMMKGKRKNTSLMEQLKQQEAGRNEQQGEGR